MVGSHPIVNTPHMRTRKSTETSSRPDGVGGLHVSQARLGGPPAAEVQLVCASIQGRGKRIRDGESPGDAEEAKTDAWSECDKSFTVATTTLHPQPVHSPSLTHPGVLPGASLTAIDCNSCWRKPQS